MGVRAVALVGSWARGAAGEDSDVDFVVLSEELPDGPQSGWFDGLPIASAITTRGRGALTEWRWKTSEGFEIDTCVGSTSWAATQPIDPGTRRVLTGGLQRIYDTERLLLELQNANIPAASVPD